MSSIAHAPAVRVVIGVDTHKDFHVAFAKDHLGRELGHRKVTADRSGYADLLEWAQNLGEIDAFGVEGPSSYGAGLARFLATSGEVVLEVGRPSREHRARHGKSDPADARAAATAVLAGDALGVPKSCDGKVEMMRLLSQARTSAVKAKRAASASIRDILVTGPEDLKEALGQLSTGRLTRACAAMDSVEYPTTPLEAAIVTLVSLSRRYQQLSEEAAALERQIKSLVAEVCPSLLSLVGVGPEIASTLLVTFGDNADRIPSEAALAKLCGVAPVDASSGRQIRHRLNRGGNRQANRALHMLVIVRLRVHEPTRAYMARRIAEGKTRKEVLRCLKRYVVREIFAIMQETLLSNRRSRLSLV